MSVSIGLTNEFRGVLISVECFCLFVGGISFLSKMIPFQSMSFEFYKLNIPFRLGDRESFQEVRIVLSLRSVGRS